MYRDTEKNNVNITRFTPKNSLGQFTNFPTTCHGIARVTFNDHPAHVQQIIVRALQKLNGSKRTYPISPSSGARTYKGKVGFEIGVAEGIYFNYLDDDMTEKVCEYITLRKLFQILDFLVIVTYHYTLNGKKIHLYFDHHQLRFIFNNKGLEMRLFHSKGTRRMPLVEFINRILNCINMEMRQHSLKSLVVEDLFVL